MNTDKTANPMLKAVLFDLDNTLLDWSGFIRETWETSEAKRLRRVMDYFHGEGATQTDEATFLVEYQQRTHLAWQQAFVNLHAPNVGRVLVEAAAAAGVPSRLLNPRRCLEAYDWGAVDGTVIFPEVPEVLTILNEAGIRIGIVTNAYQPMWMRDIEIDAFGLLDFFPTCRISAADVGYLKPHPEIFRAALECVGARPEETVFVGDDLEADIAGSQAAGMHAVLRTAARQGNPNTGATPDGVIQSLHDLLLLLDTWFAGWRGETA
ncbi:MAG: HAD family hydrolase [Anaerolineae bacterium]|nr:HAD family hydrolase [Anaerolineae bacterium]